MRRNAVFDGLHMRSSLFKFIQERMSLKVVVSVSREFVGVKEMYRWVSIISVQIIFEGILWDHRAKRSCLESEKEWVSPRPCFLTPNLICVWKFAIASCQGRHFNFFLGGAKLFFIFQCHRSIEKIGKKQYFICSNLTLFIVPFFLFSSFFSFFLFFLFFLSFFFFLFPWGGRRPPSPLKWRPCIVFAIPIRYMTKSTKLPRPSGYYRHLANENGFQTVTPSHA